MKKCEVCQRVCCTCDMLSEAAIFANQDQVFEPPVITCSQQPPVADQEPTGSDSRSTEKKTGSIHVNDFWRQGVSN